MVVLIRSRNGLELSHIDCFFGSSRIEAISLYFDCTYGFYELRSAMESPHLVIRPSKVVGGERASIAHPWNLWGVERIFAQDKAEVPQIGME